MGYLEDVEKQIDEERARATQSKLKEEAEKTRKEAEKAAKQTSDNSDNNSLI